jgi:hypothetical protein
MDTGRREQSGCLVAIYALFAIGALGLLIGGVTLFFFFQSDQGRKILAVAEKGATWMATAAGALGTTELREAGCEVAMVHRAAATIDVVMQLLPEGDRQQLREELQARAGDIDLEELLVVLCIAPRFSLNPPECSDLALVYSEAIEAEAIEAGALEVVPDAFGVIVAQQGRDSLVCEGIYTPDGSLAELGDGQLLPRFESLESGD